MPLAYMPRNALYPQDSYEDSIAAKDIEKTKLFLLQLLQDNDLDCDVVNVQIAPRYIVYIVACNKLYKLTQAKLNRVISQAGMRLCTKVKTEQTRLGDFAIAVERAKPALVPFSEVFTSTAANNLGDAVCVVGKNATEPWITLDIANAPHVLIGGTTGSGKSVLLNSILLSLMCQRTPYTNRFLLIDPKQVELSAYADSPYLLCPPVTDAEQATLQLEMMCNEIQWRYDTLERLGLKSIDEMQTERLPRIYVVIDELADLMLTSKKRVETAIVRIAQLGRAAGIHLILATQRPTVNIVTGLIKANVPTRIALATASATDSVVLLGHKGAEGLQGAGDAIIKHVDSVDEIHFQAPYATTDDVLRVKDYWIAACAADRPKGFFKRLATAIPKTEEQMMRELHYVSA